MLRADLLDHLTQRILSLPLPHPVRAALDGVDASGKTTLAAELAEALRAAAPSRFILQASIDRFHNPRHFRYRQGPDSPHGYYADSFNLDALQTHLLEPLGPFGSRHVQTGLFDFQSDTALPHPPIKVPVDTILLFDGVFLHRPELAKYWDFSIFVRVSFQSVLVRAVERDLPLFGTQEAVIERYQKRYIPAQQMYLAQCTPEQQADVVINNDDPHSPFWIDRKDRSG